MAAGPGKYDSQCTAARESANAEAAVVIIVNGNRGSGFSCQGDPLVLANLPAMLETMAQQIRADMYRQAQ